MDGWVCLPAAAPQAARGGRRPTARNCRREDHGTELLHLAIAASQLSIGRTESLITRFFGRFAGISRGDFRSGGLVSDDVLVDRGWQRFARLT